MKKVLYIFLAWAGVMSAVNAQIEITTVGDGTGYDETGLNAWRSTNVVKNFDVDPDNVTGVDNVYGTSGLFFIGDSDLFDGSNAHVSFANFTKVGADWTIFSKGADAVRYMTPASVWGYAHIDDPEATPGTDVADWDLHSGRVDSTGTGTVGDWEEMLTFTLTNTPPKKFRIGVMAATSDGNHFQPTGLRITEAGGATNTVTGLARGARLTGMVFFDVTLNKATSGSFAIHVERSDAAFSVGMTGVTFDEIYVPPKASAIMLQ